MKNTWFGLVRSFQVIRLFLKIIWAFYSLKLYKPWHNQAWLEARKQELYVSQARFFRETAVEMGGLLIKLGQFFSTRVDLLPRSSINELARLQDEVEAVPFENLKSLAEQELRRTLEQVFHSFDPEPLAAASFGQVHRAQLHDGRIAAVKIMRPGIEKLVQIDLASIRRVIYILQALTDWDRFVDFESIYQEFSQTVWEELDYINEGKNAELIAKNRASERDILFPRIYWEYTTRRVLTMEYMHGFKITDKAALRNAGIDLKALSRLLFKTYIEQMLIDGFFHADPHPGNLFVTADGKLIMVDFGMMGRISPQLRKSLTSMAVAMAKRDHMKVVSSLKNIGFLRDDADSETVARAVGATLEHIAGNAKEFSDYDLNLLLKDLEKLLYEQPFQIPANFTFLGRALATVYGLCVELYPGISFLDEAKPYLKMVTGDQATGRAILDQIVAWLESLEKLPVMAEKILGRAERGELMIKTSPALIHAIEGNTRAINNLGWTAAFVGILFTSAYLLVNNHLFWAKAGAAICVLIPIYLVMRRRRLKPRLPKHPPAFFTRNEDE